MLRASVSLPVQHLLFLFLLLVIPVWDYPYVRKLKREPTSARKLWVYKFICSWLWIATVLACLAVGFGGLFNAPGQARWLAFVWARYLMVAVIALFTLAVLLPIAVIVWKKIKNIPRRYGSAEALKSLSYFLPATWVERRWYGFLSVTAGICEEILFRGFLLRYLSVSPWRLSLTLALLISAVIFGIQHFYQGASGVVQTALMGLLFGVLFLLTGNLLAPMILHTITDLRMLALLRPPSNSSSALAAATP